MCSIHTYTHTLTLSVVCRWPSFNALEKWFDCASSAAQFAVEFLYKLGLPLMGSYTGAPLPPTSPVNGWPRLCCVRERVLCVCFKFMIWNVTLKSESVEISFAFAFVFVLVVVFWFHLLACLRFAWHFTFAALRIFFIFLCTAFRCPFADKHIRVLLFFLCFVVLFTYFIFICSLFGAGGLWDMLMMPCCSSSMRKDASIVALVSGKDNPRAELA